MTKLWVGQEQVSLKPICTKLSADCDLDLLPSDMVFVRDIASCHVDHMSQIIFKFEDEVMGRT